MSHLKERSQKNCLNCNAEVNGKYCSICGQENIEPVESVWHLVKHFFNDVTHFDGKFFSSLKFLIYKPGFLSSEYRLGRRMSYLNPIRMYVFTSAIFFLIFFTFSNVPTTSKSADTRGAQSIMQMDSSEFTSFAKELGKDKMSKEEVIAYLDSSRKESGIRFSPGEYKSKAEYDSLISTGKKKHNWLEKKLVYRQLKINEKYKNNSGELVSAFLANLFHGFPQMLFLSLPLFAVILNLLYKRHKDFFYASHAIFGIHFYVFVFIMFFILLVNSKLKSLLHWGLLSYTPMIVAVIILYYQYRALRNFYEQGRGKTILKFVLLNIAMIGVIMVLFIVFSFLSFFKI